MALLVYHKHTHYPGPGRNDHNIVGYPLFPVYVAKAGGFFFINTGVITLMGALMQINPVWIFGPYNPAEVTAGSQPDWYMGFVEGAIRIMPNWESHIGSTTWSWNVAIPGLGLMGLMFGAMAVYPFIERWVTGDTGEHHVLDRPRNVPTRTAFGVAAITSYGLFWIGGGNDLVATQFDVSLNAVTYALRILVFVGPVVAFILTKRICIGLQRAAAERMLHGAESGIIVREPTGSYHERHRPISSDEAFTMTQHHEAKPLLPVGSDTEAPARQIRNENLRRRATRFWFGDALPKPTHAELEAAAHHHAAIGHGDGHGNGLADSHGDGHGDGQASGHGVVHGTVHEDGHLSTLAEIQADEDSEYKPAH
jgi:ubiquinol-cytochrome c reductase cytochrome b subunit